MNRSEGAVALLTMQVTPIDSISIKRTQCLSMQSIDHTAWYPGALISASRVIHVQLSKSIRRSISPLLYNISLSTRMVHSADAYGET